MKKKKRVVIISAIALVVLGVAILMIRDYRSREALEEEVQMDEEAGFETITYKGERYRYNTDLKTILFMGVDNTEEVEVNEYAGRGGQSDVLMLFILDTSKKTIQTLQISRDSMVEVDVYDMDGEQIAKEELSFDKREGFGASVWHSDTVVCILEY